MVEAEEIIENTGLPLLKIPQAKLLRIELEGKTYEILAEHKLEITPDPKTQKGYFSDYAEQLNDVVFQLTRFICKTGFSHLERRKIPVINNQVDEKGNRCIALLDVGETRGVKIGIFGNEQRTGIGQQGRQGP